MPQQAYPIFKALMEDISNLKIYDTPRELREFTGLRETKFGLAPGPITRPPKSWRYVEEETWND